MLTIQPDDGYEKYLFDRAYETGTPIGGTFELLPVCNMDCRMCYIRMSPEEMRRQGRMMTAEEWLRVGRQAAEKGTLFLLLTGGEPLLHPEFPEIYEGLRSLGMVLTINTNGTMITREIADLWQRNLPRRVNISLYGSSDGIYEKYCRNPKGFTQMMEGIRLLKERGIPVKLNCTLTPWNREDMDRIIKISEELELPVSLPTYLFPPARKAGCQGCTEVPEGYRLEPEEAAREQVKAIFRAFHQEQSYEENLQRILDEIAEREELNRQRAVSGETISPPGGFLCSAGVRSFWVNWKGRLTPCGMMEAPSVDLRRMEFGPAWDVIREESSKIFTSAECFCCKYRGVCQTCAASALAETGDCGNKVPYHCEMSKAYECLVRKHLDRIRREKA